MTPPEQVIRRLTDWEYRHSVRDLLGVEAAPSALPRDERADGFSNNAGGLAPSPRHVESWFVESFEAANAADTTALVARHAACTEARTECFEGFVAGVGAELFRRPLDDAERTSFRALMSELVALESYSFEEAARLVVAGMLQSPGFLYRLERGAGATDAHELASRLSFFLHASTPDAALLASAQSGALLEEAELGRQLERLLADERFERSAWHFAGDWLRLAWVPPVILGARDLYDRGPEIQESGRQMVLGSLVSREPFIDLLVAQRVWINRGTSTLYGQQSRFPGNAMTSDGGGDPFYFDTSSDPRRTGILTHPAFLAGMSDQTGESLVQRGIFLLGALFCTAPGPPPAGIDVDGFRAMFPEGTPEREMSESRFGTEPCASCHQTFDPLAFAFEPFDADGTFHETNTAGRALRSDGAYGSPGGLLTFDDTSALVQQLRDSEAVRACLTRRVVQFALGRAPAGDEAPLVAAIHARAWEEGGDYAALARAVAQSPLFRATEAP